MAQLATEQTTIIWTQYYTIVRPVSGPSSLLWPQSGPFPSASLTPYLPFRFTERWSAIEKSDETTNSTHPNRPLHDTDDPYPVMCMLRFIRFAAQWFIWFKNQVSGEVLVLLMAQITVVKWLRGKDLICGLSCWFTYLFKCAVLLKRQ